MEIDPPAAAAAAATPAAAAEADGPVAADGPKVDEAAERQRQDALLADANRIRAEWRRLASAWNALPPEPARVKTHRDYLLQEARWLSNDMAQARPRARARAARRSSLLFFGEGLTPLIEGARHTLGRQGSPQRRPLNAAAAAPVCRPPTAARRPSKKIVAAISNRCRSGNGRSRPRRCWRTRRRASTSGN